MAGLASFGFPEPALARPALLQWAHVERRFRRFLANIEPTALQHEHAELPLTVYRPSGRERRRRAALALRGVLSNARRSIFLPLTAILVTLGVLFFLLPTATAYVFGGLCAWLALSAGREAFRRRADR